MEMTISTVFLRIWAESKDCDCMVGMHSVSVTLTRVPANFNGQEGPPCVFGKQNIIRQNIIREELLEPRSQ